MNLIDKFNHRDTFLVISDYPEKESSGGKNYGIAWFTKETIEPLSKKYNHKFVVLAEKGKDNSPKLYANGKILVLRVFDQKHHSLYPKIVNWLLKFSHINQVYVHSEFCVNGGVKNFALLIPFLALIKLMNKNITYFAHNVVTSFNSIAPHLNIARNSIKLKLLNFGLSKYYRLLGIVTDQIVVMDEVMGERIKKFVSEDKVVHAPIWTENKRYHMSKKTARAKLGFSKNDFVLLYFGFVTWYKGADWLIDQLSVVSNQLSDKKVKLILAGGPAYSLKDKTHYQEFYQKQVDKVDGIKNINLTGFVPEDKIGLYFTACDLVVMPYRGYIGSSGVLSHVLSYRKPFIISKKMGSVCQNSDFTKALKEAGVGKKDIMFGYSSKSFQEAILQAQKPNFLKKLKKLSRILSEKRSFEFFLPIYWQKIYNHNCYRNIYDKEYTKNISPVILKS